MFNTLRLLFAVLASLLLLLRPAFAQDTEDAGTSEDSGNQTSLTLPTGEELTFDVYTDPAQPTALRILWIAPGLGSDPRHHQIAQALAKRRAEVWLIDLPDALFLTKGASSMRAIPGKTVANIINALAQQAPQSAEILVVSSRYGAIPALRGIHAWQAQATRQGKLIGAVFFSPSFFTHVPELGTEPEFIDELAATNSPLYIFQAENNANRWHLAAVLDALSHAPVYTEMLKGVMSIFFHNDNSPRSLETFAKAPEMILRAAKQLRQHPMPLEALPVVAKSASTSSGINTRLRNYRGSVQPLPIKLRDISGNPFDMHNFRGKVTLVNFWATWCRPCVEEIPSLNRLKIAMQGKPFQLISVNYAETAKDIREFLTKVNVDFPVLIDPGGRLAGQWKVVAFPSTFVIGPDGKIHYGVNAGIHWDTPDVIQQLQQLLPTP